MHKRNRSNASRRASYRSKPPSARKDARRQWRRVTGGGRVFREPAAAVSLSPHLAGHRGLTNLDNLCGVFAPVGRFLMNYGSMEASDPGDSISRPLSRAGTVPVFLGRTWAFQGS